MNWEDGREPRERFFQYLCSFCGMSHTEKELIEWQIQHLSDIPLEKMRHVLRNIYRYFNLQLSLLQGSINEQISSKKEKTP
jgi:hypothetical protein